MSQVHYEDAIAVIGRSGRFAGTTNDDEFWSLLSQGKSAEIRLSRTELLKQGVPESLIDNPDYVAASMVLSDYDKFDAELFRMTDRAAALMDPQNRLLLETVWHTLENGGFNPLTCGHENLIGVFAGKNPSAYCEQNLEDLRRQAAARRDLAAELDLATTNCQDFTANWLAYKFGFRGPAINIQTACSTGLAALVVAVQNLLFYSCDMAVVAAAGLSLPLECGYLYQSGGIQSPDGFCRPFDEKAAGTVDGNGAVAFLLKRYEDALTDGDRIDALILGVGISNDGNLKQDFMAPGIEGQIQAMSAALKMSGVPAQDIDYIEAHGTGTHLGDPVEAAAIQAAFSTQGKRTKPCIVGSVKSNLGHLNAAAGLAGLYKIIECFQRQAIAPTAHFQNLNSHISWDKNEFTVTKEICHWVKNGNKPRRAALNSLGFGGTNVHVILEEAPKVERNNHQALPVYPLFVSAKTPEQLGAATTELCRHIRARVGQTENGNEFLMRASATLLHARTHLPLRAATWVSLSASQPVFESDNIRSAVSAPKAVWLFTGQGGDLAGVSDELYNTFNAYREAYTLCLNHLDIDHKVPIDDLLRKGCVCTRPSILQPALFVHQYALGQLWLSQGIRPQAVIGHSFGEIAALCIAQALPLTDALMLVQIRGAAIERYAPDDGAMLAVIGNPESMPDLSRFELCIACQNGPDVTIVAGNNAQICGYADACQQASVPTIKLNSRYAFHTQHMNGACEALRGQLDTLTAFPPKIPVFSTVTGAQLTGAPEKDYWLQHMVAPVLFSRAVDQALQNIQPDIYLEIGPSAVLAPLASRQTKICSLSSIKSAVSAGHDWLKTLGQLWEIGFDLSNSTLFTDADANASLPGYPFAHKRYWFESESPKTQENDAALSLSTENEAIASELLDLVKTYWRQYLGIDKVADNADFFSLGGTSLAALQIRQCFKKDLDIDIEMSAFMNARTPIGLTELLRNRLQNENLNDE